MIGMESVLILGLLARCNRFLQRVVRCVMYSLTVQSKFGHELLSSIQLVKPHTRMTCRIVLSLRVVHVVDLLGHITKVVDTIVLLVMVDVINVPYRPATVYVEPDESMFEVKLSEQLNDSPVITFGQ